MNNFTTLQSWDTLDLHTLKKTGADEHHGPCPVTGEGKDCFWVKPDARLMGCRGCAVNGLSGPQFTEHLSALGGSIGESVSLQTYDWTDHSTGDPSVRQIGDDVRLRIRFKKANKGLRKIARRSLSEASRHIWTRWTGEFR